MLTIIRTMVNVISGIFIVVITISIAYVIFLACFEYADYSINRTDRELFNNQSFSKPLDPKDISSDLEAIVETMDYNETVAGIRCTVIRNRFRVNTMLIRDEYYYHAVDDNGNIWLMKYDVIRYKYNKAGYTIEESTEGSWVAKPVLSNWMMRDKVKEVFE